MLKAYWYKPEVDDDSGIAIIAESVKEAKKMGWDFWGSEYGNEYLWIDVHCRRSKNKDLNIEGLSKGVITDLRVGLKHNLYGYAEDECDFCGEIKMIGQLTKDDKLMCDDCEEKMGEQK